jgi:hypothetical protein
MGDMRSAYNSLLGKLEGKSPLGRPRFRWEVILDLILGRVWTGCMWLRIGTIDVLSSY